MSFSFQDEKPPQDSKKRLRRFFSSQPLADVNEELFLDADETHHLKNAIRLGQGDRCLLTDGMGREAEAQVERFEGTRAVLKVENVRKVAALDSQVKIHVHQAYVKKIMDDVVDKAQELGVKFFNPTECQFCELRVAKDRFGKVRQRWEKILKTGAKQSGSLFLTEIGVPQNFPKSLNAAASSHDRQVIFHPSEDAVAMHDWLDDMNRQPLPENIHIWIGPEGGFSDAEVQMARERNFDIVHLGEQLLRVDTAFVAIVGAIKFGLKASD